MAVTDDDDQGGGGLSYDDDSEEVTWGEGGFSGPPKKGDVIYERPLRTVMKVMNCTRTPNEN